MLAVFFEPDQQKYHKKERPQFRFGTKALKAGGDLLSHFRSTIGAEGLNFCVRDGNRWVPLAIATQMSYTV